MNQIIKELKEIKQLLALQKKILTLDEFCSYAGISKSYAYHLTSTAKVKCYRPFGKMIYFDIEEVIEFLKQNSTTSEQQTLAKVEKYLLNQSKK